MTKNPRFLLPALALMLGLAMTACGDDEGGDAPESPETSAADTPDVPDETDTPDVPDETDIPEVPGITKEMLIEQGNALCEAGNAAIEAASEAIDTTDPEAIVPFIQTVLVPGVRAQLDGLRALGYPEGDEETLSAIYDEADAVLDGIEADPEAALASEDPFAEVNEKLTEYGLTTCGSSS